MKELMTGAERAAAEDAALQAAEAEFNGTQVDPQVEAELAPEGTPNEVPQEPAEQPQEDWESRYKNLQSHASKKEAELLAQIKELSGNTEPTTEDEVAALKAELEQLKGIEAERQTESHVAQAQQLVGEAHPDFVGIIQSPEFAEWIKGRPQVYQDAIYADRPDATMAIDALTLYKSTPEFQGRVQAAQQQEINDQAAMSVNSGHREQPQGSPEKIWSWAEINALSPNEYAKHEADIDKAMFEGRIR